MTLSNILFSRRFRQKMKLYDSIYMKFENRQLYSDGGQITGYLGAGSLEKELTVKMWEEILVSVGNVYILTVVVIIEECTFARLIKLHT